MAKKAAKKAPTGQLGDWLDKVPAAVQAAADDYDKAHTTKSKAQGKLNTAKENLIASMRANGVTKVRIRNGDKILVVNAMDKISYAKPDESIPA